MIRKTDLYGIEPETETMEEIYRRKTHPQDLTDERLMHFFKVLGIYLYVFSFVINIWLHIIILHVVPAGDKTSWMFWLFYAWSFIAFTHATVFIFDFIFSIIPPVVEILNGSRKVNNEAYMNTLSLDYSREDLPEVTISIPVYMEENGVIFETTYRSKLAAQDYMKRTGKKCNVVVSDDGIGVLLKKGPTIPELEEK